MIKRTIEVSSGPCRLSVANGQMIIERKDHDPVTIPCEDIGVLLLDQTAASYTHNLMTTLLEAGAVIVFCGSNHLPVGMLLPFSANLVQTERFRGQVSVKIPIQKQLWQQIVRAKILFEADVIGQAHPDYQRLRDLSHRVKSGDSGNVEAQAAKIYWHGLFPAGQFHRDPDGECPNNFLNYGYAVLRAAIARSLCGTGLHPSIGIHHKNKYNPYCLADDLLEPFRTMVDVRARKLWKSGKTSLDREAKAYLLEVLTDPVAMPDTTGPFMVALPRLTASLCRCFEGLEKNLEIPRPCNYPDTDVCGS